MTLPDMELHPEKSTSRTTLTSTVPFSIKPLCPIDQHLGPIVQQQVPLGHIILVCSSDQYEQNDGDQFLPI